MRLRSTELIGGTAFLVLGALIVFGSVDLGIGTLTRPGPGFMSLGVGSMMSLLALLTILSGLRVDKGKVAPDATFPSPLVVISLIGAMTLFGLLVERVGFPLCTFLFMLAVHAIGSGTPPRVRGVLSAGAVTMVIYFIFERLLLVGLPAGSWWN